MHSFTHPAACLGFPNNKQAKVHGSPQKRQKMSAVLLVCSIQLARMLPNRDFPSARPIPSSLGVSTLCSHNMNKKRSKPIY